MSLISDALLTNNLPTNDGYKAEKFSTKLVELSEAEANVLGKFMDF